MLRFRPCLALLLALGCGSDTAAPKNILVGQWGGRGLLLTADHNVVRAQFQCDAAVFHAPLAPDRAGEFVLPGTVSAANSSVQLGARGVMSGAAITLEV